MSTNSGSVHLVSLVVGVLVLVFGISFLLLVLPVLCRSSSFSGFIFLSPSSPSFSPSFSFFAVNVLNLHLLLCLHLFFLFLGSISGGIEGILLPFPIPFSFLQTSSMIIILRMYANDEPSSTLHLLFMQIFNTENVIQTKQCTHSRMVSLSP